MTFHTWANGEVISYEILREAIKTDLFRVVVEPDEDRWFAYCPVLEDKGAATWGYTQEEGLKKNIREVVEMTIGSMIGHGEPIPTEPSKDVSVSSEPLVGITTERNGLLETPILNGGMAIQRPCSH